MKHPTKHSMKKSVIGVGFLALHKYMYMNLTLSKLLIQYRYWHVPMLNFDTHMQEKVCMCAITRLMQNI